MCEDSMHANSSQKTSTEANSQPLNMPHNSQNNVSTLPMQKCSNDPDTKLEGRVQRTEGTRSESRRQIDLESECDSLRRRVCELEHAISILKGENEIWKGKYKILEKSNAKIVDLHERSLNGMQDRLELVKVVAALEVEKSTRESLVKELLVQKRKLMSAEEKIKSSMMKLEEYHRNEKVLTHTILLSDRREEVHIRQRTTELIQTCDTLKADLETEKSNFAAEAQRCHLRIDELQAQVETYRQALDQCGQARATLEQQCQCAQDETNSIKQKIQMLETETAVARSKHEQLEKADSHLRTQLKQQSMELEHTMEENKLLRQENRELKTIADELMALAEKQEEEKQKQKQMEGNMYRMTALPHDQKTLGKRRTRHSLA